MLKKIVRALLLARGSAPLSLGGARPVTWFCVRTALEVDKVLTGDGEKNLIRRFLDELRPGDTMFDIGANIGLFSVAAGLGLRGSGQVHAFEPVGPWMRRLQENVRFNGLDNVVVHNVGLSSAPGEAVIHLKNILGSGMASIMTSYEGAGSEFPVESERIRLVKGDDFIADNGLPIPDVVKVDVEGAEHEVFSGLRSTLAAGKCRLILCEVHPQYLNVAPEKVHRSLEEHGFRVEKLSSRADEYHILARRQP